ncbi:outer membrane lipoprotein [Salmonella enterica subsp. enterica]|nr:outer membrane lipoprotein [Salmonella enterica subsp. enterica]VUC90306.1 outer membrane lipoprotein [Salmonella sp. NCTC 11881]
MAKTIVTDGKPEVDNDTGMVSYKNAATGKTEQINRDQLKNMSELDN